MQQLWAQGPLTVREILATYSEPRPHFNTISTLVRILVDKGYVEHKGTRDGAFLFQAKVGPEFFSTSSLASVVRNFFNDSYRAAVSALVEDEKISLDELREIIDMVEKANNEK